MNTKMEWIRVIAFHAQVVLGMVLLIIGITQEISNKTSHATTLMKVGVVVLLLCDVVLAVWTWLSFNQVQHTTLPAWDDATLVSSPSSLEQYRSQLNNHVVTQYCFPRPSLHIFTNPIQRYRHV